MSPNYCAWLIVWLVAAHALPTPNDEPPPPPHSPVGPFDATPDESISPPINITSPFEGDIKRPGRAGSAGTLKPWPNGIIPYTFHCSIKNKPTVMAVVYEAIYEWQNNTCVRFVKKKADDEAYIEFIRLNGCWATYVGYKEAKFQISIGKGCDYKHVMVHEIGHVVGFWHEQTRPDRDNYVRINKPNVYPSMLYNFKKRPKGRTSNYGVGYDYGSIMHYPYNAFAINRRQLTIVPIRNTDLNPYQRLSAGDVEQTRRMYKCDDLEVLRAQKAKLKARVKRNVIGGTDPDCKDGNAACPKWKGYCKKNKGVSLLCPRTCNLCPGQNGCVDELKRCNKLKRYCEINKNVMERCRKTCNKCLETTIAAQTIPTTTPTTTSATTPEKTTTQEPTTAEYPMERWVPDKLYTGQLCEDRSENCDAWAKEGRCSTDQWVKRNCHRACKRYNICDLQPIKIEGVCAEPFGISTYYKKWKSFTFYATSVFKPGRGWEVRAFNARLYLKDDHNDKEIGAWCADPQRDRKPSLTIRFPKPKRVTGVVIQGRDNYFEHAEKLTISYFSNSKGWQDYKENGKIKIYDGNCDNSTPVAILIKYPFIATELRITVVKYVGAACLRVEIFGCDLVPNIST